MIRAIPRAMDFRLPDDVEQLRLTVRAESSRVKLFASEALGRARIARIYEGTSEVQRGIIATHLLS